MAAPIVYRWDDGNAPVARGERRSLCDILYACLVTGYGSKPGAGWTREYVNATFDKAAFRNNPLTGTGFFLQVDGFGAANAYTPIVQGFEAMTSESDGLFPFNASTQAGPLSNAANTTARPWILMADDRAFYFFCWSTITGTPNNTHWYTTAMFFGDPVSRYPIDPYCCGLVCNGSNGSFGYVYSSDSITGALGGPGFAMPRRATGAVGSILSIPIRGGGPGASALMGATGLPYTPGDQILITRPHLNEAEAYSFRGWLPGLYYPCHPSAFTQLQNINSDGKSFINILTRAVNVTGAGNFFISLDDWRI